MKSLKSIGMLTLVGATLLVFLATPLVATFIWAAENTPHGRGGIDPSFYWVLFGPWTVLACIWGYLILGGKDSD